MSRDTFSLLGAIKCSNCNADVDISELGDHVCSPVKEVEEPAPVVSLKLQYGNERQGKHTLPPIDSNAANRPYLGRDQPTPRSSSEDGTSPATPFDGQPLSQPFSPPEESAGSSNYTDYSPLPSGASESNPSDQAGTSTQTIAQHLYAPPANSAMYAPVSPTATAGKSLMEKLSSISPGPFALQSSSQATPPQISSGYGERPTSSRGKDREEAADMRPQGGRSPEPPAVSRRDSDAATEKARPPTSGSDRSSGSRSSGPDSPKSRKNVADLRLKKADTMPVEKPLPSPSYMAYRPPQPPVRLPRSPTFPEQRPITPAYGARPPQVKALRGVVGLPSSPAHGRKQSMASNNSGPTSRRPSADNQQQQPGFRRPSADGPQQPQEDNRSRSQQRNPDRLAPDARDRSRSTPRSRDGEPNQARQQRPEESMTVRNDVGNPYKSPPSSTASYLHSSSPNGTGNIPRKMGSTASRTSSRSRNGASPPSPMDRSGPLPYPPLSSGYKNGNEATRRKQSPTRLDIDSLLKDLQNSIEDLAKSPLREDTPQSQPPAPAPVPNGVTTKPVRGPPAALTITKPSQMVEPGPPSARILSPTRKTAQTKSNCRGCSQAIQGKGLTSSDGRLTGRYHKHCFVCQTCREPFSSSTFYVWDNLPYCQRHYHVLNNSLCRRCDHGIEGACLETEKNERFHPECFTCVDCQRVLGDDYFEFNGRPYCEQHAYRMMQQRSRLGPGGRGMQGKMERRRTRLMMM